MAPIVKNNVYGGELCKDAYGADFFQQDAYNSDYAERCL